MGEFRIGRKFAQHSYPDTRAATSVPYARNFAEGPALVTVISAGETLPVPWEGIESGAPAGIDVPITPKSTGILLIEGVISIKTAAEAPVDVQVGVWIDGASLFPVLERVTIPAQGFAALPFVTLTELGAAAVGVTKNVQIKVTASNAGAISLVAQSSTISIQEVSPATG